MVCYNGGNKFLQGVMFSRSMYKLPTLVCNGGNIVFKGKIGEMQGLGLEVFIATCGKSLGF